MAAMHSGRAVLWLQCVLGEQCYGCNVFWESSDISVHSGRVVLWLQCILRAEVI